MKHLVMVIIDTFPSQLPPDISNSSDIYALDITCVTFDGANISDVGNRCYNQGIVQSVSIYLSTIFLAQLETGLFVLRH